MKTILSVLSLGLSLQALADIDNTFRQNNAVVLYDFAETSGDIIDKASPKVIPTQFRQTGDPTNYPQLDLRIYAPTQVVRTLGTGGVGTHSLLIDAPNLIKSRAPARKVNELCKASGSMSFEIYLANSETVIERSGMDPSMRHHPLRIVNLSRPAQSGTGATGLENLYSRNFVFGQFYDMGNFYETGVRTSQNEPNAASMGNALVQPLMSTVAQTIVPDPAIGRINPVMQKVVFTLGPSGVARLYLSDMNGNMFQAQEATTGFGNSTASNYFSNWFNDAYLSVGNTYMTDSEFVTELAKNSQFTSCGPGCFNHKHRYWKGEIRLLAIYCQELTRAQVLGANAVDSVLQNTTNFPIDPNLQATPAKLKAQEMFNRLTGIKTPLSDPRITEMETHLLANNPVAAANVATTKEPRFLNVTVRDFAAIMSNRESTVNTPLNDFIATVVGATRDDLNAQRLLTDDILYMGDPSKAPVASDIANDLVRSNSHYQALETGRYDLQKVLVQTTQSIFDGTRAIPNPAPAGLLTTRQWMAEHAIAGTNRRLVEYVFKQFLCSPIETVADSTGPDSVVGPDIDRFPGGSHTKFTTTCRACHTILDGFRPAFSRWTFGNGFAKHAFVVPAIGPMADENAAIGMQEDPAFPNVSAKLNRNSDVFPDGRRTVDEKWVNNAIFGANATNFRFTKTSGSGLREFGQMIASSPKFAKCMAERAFRQVCKRNPNNTDNFILDQAAQKFSTNGYKIRELFEIVVTGDNCL